ncbi:MAG TPA: glycosyltransferase N-terminal domain-containing protein [Chitinophaga sp.]|uniref:3-deoxy-D-manno-octulosonic acid transferase n=1 Tax=Chitinophaga sp. TaxID=1869181 RepID=UPI002DB57A60|nr:glycosyltransferase N-terminal domain-containing protein [Chitinophaga sp.]HEU4553772.1 glycosyltransferase N-terminal domain-containing protein [Chitinophaga sp.]
MFSTFFYNLGIALYNTGVKLAAATGNTKAAEWLQGRRNWASEMQKDLAANGKKPVVWIHAASLGEFEQGRPLLEALRKQYPEYCLVLTFFSPSGYQVQKDCKEVDYVYYLPLDTRKNARLFLDIVQPQLAIFIKYEFWYHFMHTLYQRQVPAILISGIFRKEQPFFKWYGGLFRRLLQQLTYIFVQNEASLQCLQQIGISHVTVAGDTRFDRVWALQHEAVERPLVKQFTGHRNTIVAGSTWESDEAALSAWWAGHYESDRRLVIAPHEIHESHIMRLLELFPGALRYSDLAGTHVSHPEDGPHVDIEHPGKVLIIDNIGMLSSLYRYACVAYVGGGFDKNGIHNVLEPATYGKPVVFGPVYEQYAEAVALVALGGAFTVPHEPALSQQMEALLTNDELCTQAGYIAGRYVSENRGATGKILAYIQEKRFLTSE